MLLPPTEFFAVSMIAAHIGRRPSLGIDPIARPSAIRRQEQVATSSNVAFAPGPQSSSTVLQTARYGANGVFAGNRAFQA
jgi:hypothetical protein